MIAVRTSHRSMKQSLRYSTKYFPTYRALRHLQMPTDPSWIPATFQRPLHAYNRLWLSLPTTTFHALSARSRARHQPHRLPLPTEYERTIASLGGPQPQHDSCHLPNIYDIRPNLLTGYHPVMMSAFLDFAPDWHIPITPRCVAEVEDLTVPGERILAMTVAS